MILFICCYVIIVQENIITFTWNIAPSSLLWSWNEVTGENDSDSDDNNPACCQVYNDLYNVMRSGAFVPITPQSFSTREVIGEESDIDYHSTQGSDSPSKDP